MTLALTVDELAWRAHLDRFAGGCGDDLIPVVKGNGYGFGRRTLIAESARLGARRIAVGTIHELPTDDSAAGLEVIVLTPTLDALAEEVDPAVVLTVGSVGHLSHLRDAGFAGRMVVKLAGSMHRYGVTAGELAELVAEVGEPYAYGIHPPLAGDDAGHLADIEAWLAHLDPEVPVQLSHLGLAALDRLRGEHPERRFHLRSGTALWHGERSAMHLSADVVDVRAVSRGQRVGYRQVEVAGDGWLVMVGAGTAHGVAPLADGRSPFHHSSRRLDLVEPPHMHTSMLFVPTGSPVPRPGDTVDVQRPLSQTWVDRVVWIR